MKSGLLLRSAMLAGICSIIMTVQGRADLASSLGVLTEINSIAVEAKSNLAEAGVDGNADAIAAAKKISDAVEAVLAEAKNVYAVVERSYRSGDAAGAAASEKALQDLLAQAKDAMNGKISAALAQRAVELQSQKKIGGGPGLQGTPPNINDDPWKSKGLRGVYEEMFGEWWLATASHQGFGDREVTPE